MKRKIINEKVAKLIIQLAHEAEREMGNVNLSTEWPHIAITDEAAIFRGTAVCDCRVVRGFGGSDRVAVSGEPGEQGLASDGRRQNEGVSPQLRGAWLWLHPVS